MNFLKQFNSKGMMGIPKFLNLILGIIVLGVGGIGLFGEQIGFTLPELPSIIFSGLIALGGLFILLDGFMGTSGMTNLMPRSINLFMGFVILIAGVVLVLEFFKIIPVFEVPNMIIHGVLIFGGVILFLDGIIGANNY